MKRNLLISIILIVLVVIGRLIPHVWNFTPVVAVTLLAGAVLPRWWAVGVPVVAMFISDLIIGFYHMPIMLTVYGSFAFVALLGYWLKNFSPHRIVMGSLASSTFFFLTTNFAVWAASTWYPKTVDGLLLSYSLGLPFFRNMMIGDLFFSGVVFGLWVLLRRPVIIKAKLLLNKNSS
ncbi:MAG: DUF6580 family putative transport protein [Patescibacteria group bacterium]